MKPPIKSLFFLSVSLALVMSIASCNNDDDDGGNPNLCAGSSLSVSVTSFQLNLFAEPSGGVPPYSLEWSNGETADSLFSIFPGVYSVSVTDAEGCTASATYELINFCAGSDLSVTIIASLLSAEAQISGGEPPYIYSWNNGSAELAIQDVQPGIYTFQVTDQTGCTVVQSVKVGSGCGGTTSVTDANGRTYATVEIGGQCWMAENLATPIYSNGDSLINLSAIPIFLLNNEGGFLAFPDDTLNEPDYGFLYNWHATADPRNLCPTGWHVPTDSDIEVLVNLQGGSTVAGGKLKSTMHWNEPNAGATNSSGFTALPAGESLSFSLGEFTEVGQLGAFWSANDEAGSDFAQHLSLSASFATASRFFKNKNNAISVRCIKDE